jgi:hypothetical protein
MAPMNAASSLAPSRVTPDSRLASLRTTLRTDRAALWTHIASLLVGLGVIFFLDRNRWFLWDEWYFFTTLHPWFLAGDWKDFLFAPYVTHWVTIPNLLWEAAYRIGGTHHYWVYLVAPLSAHAGVVALVRVIMRRLGVGAWLATILSVPVLLTGVGAGNLVFGWQIAFTGAVFFGLGQLVITDHEGPIDWRDFAGLGLGLLGLMFSAVSLPMVAMVGINLVIRSRPRAAALAVLPLAAVFLTWYALIGHRGTPIQPVFQLAALPQFVWTGVSATLDGLTGIAGAAAVIVFATVYLAIGLNLTPLRPGYSTPWAMAAGAILFFFEAGYGRIGAGVGYATGSRYLYIGLVCLLPLIAMVIARYMHIAPARWALAGFLAWAMIFNLGTLYLEVHLETVRGEAVRNVVTALATNPALDSMDGSRPVDVPAVLYLTVGVVQRMHRQGDLP